MPDFSLPLFDQPDPVPYHGTTATTRAASFSGAVHALTSRGEKVATARQLWQQPRTMNEIAAITHWPISSVCSIRKCLEMELEEVDRELIDWGPDKPATYRTRWQVKK